MIIFFSKLKYFHIPFWDFLVNFVYKKEIEPFSISTVPCHIECVKTYKKENHEKHAAFVQKKSDEYEIEVKKREKEFDKKLEINK